MAADNTSGFNCRYADAPGPPTWSMHAYGLAIDVNTAQNPYLEPALPARPWKLQQLPSSLVKGPPSRRLAERQPYYAVD